jgi:hypothetical protein
VASAISRPGGHMAMPSRPAEVAQALLDQA